MSQGPRTAAPLPTDRPGWRKAVNEQRLSQFRMEEIVGAVQAMLRDNDQSLLNSLVGYVSDALMRMLAKRVSKTHRNEGRDIIERAHDKLIDAVLRPDSADGKALRTTFGSCVRFRLADAIRHEQVDSEREPSYDLDEAGEPIEPANESSWLNIEASAEIEEILSVIKDGRKRLAFRLSMERVPYDSKDGHSISKALGISEKTARDWVREVQAQLKQWMETNHDRARQRG